MCSFQLLAKTRNGAKIAQRKKSETFLYDFMPILAGRNAFDAAGVGKIPLL
jgi:hypothetical protein